MNSLQRIGAAINFAASDRVPVIAQVFGHAAVMEHVPLGDYLKNGEILAHCQLKALDRYGYDAVFALMDTGVETEAAGSRLYYQKDDYPYVEQYVLAGADEVKRLAVPDPQSSGRMPEILKAAKMLRRETGDGTLVVGCVMGPMTLAIQLLGAEKALFLAADEPEAFNRVLDYAAEVAIVFGLAQIDAGAHLPVVFDPSASPAVIPSGFFREFELPRLTRVFAAFKEKGAMANWLHIAGPAETIYPYYPEAGVDIANADYCVDPLRARQTLPRTCFDGNIRPLSFVTATANEIAAESARLIDLFSPEGGFILSSGCEIPPESRPENVAAMISATRSEV